MIPTHPNDRDYFFDTEENIYQVIGYVHPVDFVYCLQKYTKITEKEENFSQFEWKSQLTNQFYHRNISMYSSKIATSIIRKNKYRKFSDVYGVEFIQFPKSEIKLYLDPRKKLNLLRNQVLVNFSSLTDQEKYAIELSHIFEKDLGIDVGNMGVTGSILWEGVHANSD